MVVSALLIGQCSRHAVQKNSISAPNAEEKL